MFNVFEDGNGPQAAPARVTRERGLNCVCRRKNALLIGDELLLQFVVLLKCTHVYSCMITFVIISRVVSQYLLYLSNIII